MAEERKRYEHYCCNCGRVFYTFGVSKRQVCDECNSEKKREYQKKYRENKKKRKSKFEGKTLLQIEREREIYNKENKSNLTYGQFVLLMEKR